MSAISLYARPSATFDAKLAHSLALLRQAAAQHTPLAQASSLGAEDVVVTHLIQLADINASVFVLDTGKLHAETLALVARIEQRHGIAIDIYRPSEEAVVHFVHTNGEDAMYRSLELRKACCHIRKMEPLERALAGKGGWITGLRREQSGARADVPDLVQETTRVKVNPIADWTWGDVWHFIATHQLDYNELHDQFMPSIGCVPCTRAIAVGEDFRAGRWWWENESAKECGLHVAADVQALPHNDNQGQPA